MLEEELQYFIDNQGELLKRHLGRALVIRGKEVVGVYETPLQAYLASKKNYELGTFLIQRCEPGPDAYTITLANAA